MNEGQMLERVAVEVRSFVERRFAPLTAEITGLRDALEQQADAHAREVEALKRSLAAIELKAGPAGQDGAPGKDGAPGQDGGEGIDGRDGKDGLHGKDGIDGRDGKDGLHGKDGKDGADGKDGLHGKDGAPGADGRHGERGERGENGADGMDGRDGSHGLHGKDGLQLDDFDAAIAADGRTLELSFTLSDGLVKTKQLPLRGMVVDRGIYRAGAKHVHGDAVTFAGSYWIAQADTDAPPGNGSADWRLAVKRGRDGKDATGGEE